MPLSRDKYGIRSNRSLSRDKVLNTSLSNRISEKISDNENKDSKKRSNEVKKQDSETQKSSNKSSTKPDSRITSEQKEVMSSPSIVESVEEKEVITGSGTRSERTRDIVPIDNQIRTSSSGNDGLDPKTRDSKSNEPKSDIEERLRKLKERLKMSKYSDSESSDDSDSSRSNSDSESSDDSDSSSSDNDSDSENDMRNGRKNNSFSSGSDSESSDDADAADEKRTSAQDMRTGKEDRDHKTRSFTPTRKVVEKRDVDKSLSNRELIEFMYSSFFVLAISHFGRSAGVTPLQSV